MANGSCGRDKSIGRGLANAHRRENKAMNQAEIQKRTRPMVLHKRRVTERMRCGKEQANLCHDCYHCLRKPRLEMPVNAASAFSEPEKAMRKQQKPIGLTLDRRIQKVLRTVARQAQTTYVICGLKNGHHHHHHYRHHHHLHHHHQPRHHHLIISSSHHHLII